MTDHYYSSNPSVESNPFSFESNLKGHSFVFTSDLGVFSKREVDYGSRLLIEAFDLPDVSGDLLDVGCGYGPIGLALGKKYPDRNITMTDINERAVGLAKQNSIQNKVPNVTIYKSNLFDDIEQQSFAAILTNPPIRTGKKTVHELFECSYDYLAPNGELWIVIQKKQGAPSAIEKLKTIFGFVEVIERKKGYYIIKSKKC